ncbi:MAG: hypothetical protein GVY11_02200 [Gammaproteobacteria bacterium]|jgi:hypothetical protein|nr:hypothetical protein [Gammaproteobacteria bacterium]
MTHFSKGSLLVSLGLACALILSACEQSGPSDSTESVLRVHDVTGLQIDTLDEKLNELLSREDLPLRGKVELLDDNRLAVNASRFLQDEIATMIDQLRVLDSRDTIERPFRVQYWFLRMAKDEGSEDVPEDVVSDLKPLLDRFDGYSLSVEDYLETHHRAASSVGRVSSGRGAFVLMRSTQTTAEGIALRARIHSPGQSSSINYEVNHELKPGRALVLGKVHDGGNAEQASYQVLVARAEWTDTAD